MEGRIKSSSGEAKTVEEIEKQVDDNRPSRPTSLKDTAIPTVTSAVPAISPEIVRIPPASDPEKQAGSTVDHPTDDLLARQILFFIFWVM